MRILTICLSAFLVVRPAFGQATCHVADEYSAAVLHQITSMMDSSHAQARTEFGVPLVQRSDIALESDSATCVRAGQVVDSLLHSWNPTATVPPWSNPLYVFKIGASHAAMDRSIPNQSAYWVLFFTSAWAFTVPLRM
jgi:hypothetical protein